MFFRPELKRNHIPLSGHGKNIQVMDEGTFDMDTRKITRTLSGDFDSISLRPGSHISSLQSALHFTTLILMILEVRHSIPRGDL
jgi:hypothetical protein